MKSDNGPQFISRVFKDVLVEHGIKHRTSLPLWPQADGEVERQNRTLLKALKIGQVEGKRWQDELQKFLLAYRSMPQASMGARPAFLMFGREILTKLAIYSESQGGPRAHSTVEGCKRVQAK